MTGEHRTPTALAAYRVVDLSDSVGGQFCARLFADMGADVTLVEPAGGTATRGIGPFDRKGRSLQFFHLNYNKKVLALSPTNGEAALDGLLQAADVVVASGGLDARRALALERASLDATRIASTSPLHWARPCQARSNAVPCATLVRTIGSPSVMLTARCMSSSLSAMWP